MFALINIILDVLAGILAWNIVDPDNFGGAILFLILWTVFAGVSYLISIFIMGIIAGDLNKKR